MPCFDPVPLVPCLVRLSLCPLFYNPLQPSHPPPDLAFAKPYGVTIFFVEPQECRGALRAGDDATHAQKCYDELQTQLMMIFLTNLLIGNLSERLSSQSAAISEWLSERYEAYQFRERRRRAKRQGADDALAEQRAIAMRPRRRTSSRCQNAKQGGDGGRAFTPQSASAADMAAAAAVGYDRPPSPTVEIHRELAEAERRSSKHGQRSPHASESAAIAAAAASWQRTLARQPTRDILRGSGGKRRTHPHAPITTKGRNSAGLDARKASWVPLLMPGGIEEYQSLSERLDEQDDLPMLLSEEHGLGPTFYEYNEIALQFGYLTMVRRSNSEPADSKPGPAARAACARFLSACPCAPVHACNRLTGDCDASLMRCRSSLASCAYYRSPLSSNPPQPSHPSLLLPCVVSSLPSPSRPRPFSRSATTCSSSPQMRTSSFAHAEGAHPSCARAYRAEARASQSHAR
jgi:hypothetical protein